MRHFTSDGIARFIEYVANSKTLSFSSSVRGDKQPSFESQRSSLSIKLFEEVAILNLVKTSCHTFIGDWLFSFWDTGTNLGRSVNVIYRWEVYMKKKVQRSRKRRPRVKNVGASLACNRASPRHNSDIIFSYLNHTKKRINPENEFLLPNSKNGISIVLIKKWR